MISVDVELVLVGLVAMLEPATLISSVLVLVLGGRPLRTGFWFYIGGIGATLSVGVVAAFVLGNAATSRTSSPKTWVSIFSIVAGTALLGYLARVVRRPGDPKKTAANVERIAKLTTARPVTIVGAGAVLANAGVFMVIALTDISQLNPSTSQYILDWVLFSVASMLPLGVALVLLLVAPQWTTPRLATVRGLIERHARTVAMVIVAALAVSLLRDGISGLAG